MGLSWVWLESVLARCREKNRVRDRVGAALGVYKGPPTALFVKEVLGLSWVIAVVYCGVRVEAVLGLTWG